ncbi:MAG TPA: hypothetical protein VF449_13315 [Parvibaculum sp.]
MNGFFAAVLAASVVFVVPASAKDLPQRSAEPAQGTCELTCQSRNDEAGMSTRIDCVEHMNAKQCAVVADHKNLNDAYPVNFNCSARLVEVCTESGH